MDITMIGLQNAGKTSLLRVLAGGEFTIDSIPTVGFNMKRVQKGHVTLKWFVILCSGSMHAWTNRIFH